MNVGSAPQTVLQAYRYLKSSQEEPEAKRTIESTGKNHSETHYPTWMFFRATLLLCSVQVLQLGPGYLTRKLSRRKTVLIIDHKQQ